MLALLFGNSEAAAATAAAAGTKPKYIWKCRPYLMNESECTCFDWLFSVLEMSFAINRHI